MLRVVLAGRLLLLGLACIQFQSLVCGWNVFNGFFNCGDGLGFGLVRFKVFRFLQDVGCVFGFRFRSGFNGR